ncbi:MAG: hydratase [Oscillospiraceae bacterium]|nr:hydratase [Oscillospiraceae bacterium]
MKLWNQPVRWEGGKPVCGAGDREKTIAYRILRSHDIGGGEQMKLRFDNLISHDITYVGILQTAIASGLKEFPVPYTLTNCHNSLCAVGGTINEDDHLFGLSAAQKFGGTYVPANLAVIHQYAREMLAASGGMILGSDSHTRYGALGTMGVGEGGPELVRQLLSDRYEIDAPKVVLVYLTGKPRQGVGPHDAAIALCGAVYENGFVKNRVLEFAGPGVAALPMDYRIGIDVMTTETACLSSVWQTDGRVEEYFAEHGRPDAYRELKPMEGAGYDAMIELDLGKLEPMAALPFHPSNAVTIRELCENGGDILRETEKSIAERFGAGKLHLTDKWKNGKLTIGQGVIAGCAGGMYDNIAEAAAILDGHDVGNGAFSLSIYPPSVPVQLELLENGVQTSLLRAGALFKSCFCGPCFGAGDVPANDTLSIRHTTRNFPNREGSRPADGQLAGVLLMDARSIAATARNHGVLTAATEVDYTPPKPCARRFADEVYQKRCYFGFGKPKPETELVYGPNIAPWPAIPELPEHLLLRFAAVLHDPVTTTDELIPSGETSSYRSNPMKLASFALSRREPDYVPRTAALREMEEARRNGKPDAELSELYARLGLDENEQNGLRIGSILYAERPGDGSAREQAASCQRVLGGCANLCFGYATRRYRANCVNWGILPFTMDEPFTGEADDWLWLPNIRAAVENGEAAVEATLVSKNGTRRLRLSLADVTEEERAILLDGCLMNRYKKRGNAK